MKNILKRRNKKGFTIVELVIVIGVIGILSAILIPTFVNVTRNAERAALKANLSGAYSSYVSEAGDEVFDGVYKNSTGATTRIELLSQEKVCLNFDGGWYIFAGEWTAEGFDSNKKGALVVEAATTPDTYYEYKKVEDVYQYVALANTTRESLSTFGSAVFYAYNA